MTTGNVETAPSGRIARVDTEFCTLTGRTEDELVGTLRFVDVLTNGSKVLYEMRSTPLLDLAGSFSDVALDVLQPDGTRVPVLVTATLDRTDTGQPRLVRYTVQPTEG